jgi:hypothetical protein
VAAGQRLTWVLCDLQGNQLEVLNDRLQGRVDGGVSAPRAATCAISLEHPAVSLIKPMQTKLKVFLGADLLVNAPIFLPSHAAGGAQAGGAGGGAAPGGSLTISAASNLRLQSKFTRAFPVQTAIDQLEIAALLVEHADATAGEKAAGIPGHGIIRGSLPVSVPRDRTYYDGAQIWGLIDDLSRVIGGFEYDLRALDRTDGIGMAFDGYPGGQGADKSQTVFLEFGVGRENAGDFVWEPSGEEIVNRHIMAGATPDASPTTPTWISEQLASQALFGIYEGFEVDTDISVLATLKEHADAIVSRNAFPINYFTVVPNVEQGGTAVAWARGPDGALTVLGEGYGVPPKFAPSGDYWQGDRITVVAKKAQLAVQLVGRVVSWTLTEVDSVGNVAAEVQCEPVVVPTAVSGYSTNLTLGPEDTVVSGTSVPDAPESPAPAAPAPGVTVWVSPYHPH